MNVDSHAEGMEEIANSGATNVRVILNQQGNVTTVISKGK